MALEKLAHPPIVEVICGVIFEELPGIDPLILGVYLDRRREEFSRHQLFPAIGAPNLILGVGQGYPPSRTWFISPDDSLVIQLQSDRFYLNWRERGGTYPRFSHEHGLLERALSEYAQFSDFCLEKLGQRPVSREIELGKTDHFVRGRHFRDAADLAEMIPTLQLALSLTRTDASEVALRLGEAHELGSLRVILQSAVVMAEGGRRDAILRLETTVNRRIENPSVVAEAFTEANDEANHVFDALIPLPQRISRFQGALA